MFYLTFRLIPNFRIHISFLSTGLQLPTPPGLLPISEQLPLWDELSVSTLLSTSSAHFTKPPLETLSIIESHMVYPADRAIAAAAASSSELFKTILNYTAAIHNKQGVTALQD